MDGPNNPNTVCGAPGTSFDSLTHAHTCTFRNPTTAMATRDNRLNAQALRPQSRDVDSLTDPESDDGVCTIPQIRVLGS